MKSKEENGFPFGGGVLSSKGRRWGRILSLCHFDPAIGWVARSEALFFFMKHRTDCQQPHASQRREAAFVSFLSPWLGVAAFCVSAGRLVLRWPQSGRFDKVGALR